MLVGREGRKIICSWCSEELELQMMKLAHREGGALAAFYTTLKIKARDEDGRSGSSMSTAKAATDVMQAWRPSARKLRVEMRRSHCAPVRVLTVIRRDLLFPILHGIASPSAHSLAHQPFSSSHRPGLSTTVAALLVLFLPSASNSRLLSVLLPSE